MATAYAIPFFLNIFKINVCGFNCFGIIQHSKEAQKAFIFLNRTKNGYRFVANSEDLMNKGLLIEEVEDMHNLSMLKKNLAIHGGKPVRNSILRLADPVIREDDVSQVMEVLKSKWISEGKKVREFEKRFSDYIGTRYSVAVSSGTAALHAACAVSGIKMGDEVIVPSFSHISTANAVMYVGATPVFAEINPNTYNLDPIDVEQRITSKTKAIIPVHWAGHPAEMDRLMDIAERNKLLLIEDSCQALGAYYHSQMVGSIGDMACFSFYPSKIITTGEGGMLVTDNEEIYEKTKHFRYYGQSWDKRFFHTILGYNYRISEIQGALGITQLDKVEEIIAKKRHVASELTERLKNVHGISPPIMSKHVRDVFMHYMIQVDEDTFGVSRDLLVEALNAENIQCRVYIPPIHLQPYYREKFGYEEGHLPITEATSKKVLTIPCAPNLIDNDIDDIISAINKIRNAYKD